MLDIKLKLKPGHTSQREWMRPSVLKTLFWSVTYACNFHCRICFTDSGVARYNELNTTQAKAFLDKAKAAGVCDIIISGGEPFVRSDMIELLCYMKKLGISARIASNGSLLKDSVLDKLKRDTLTKSFQISLDTLDPTIYNKIHGAPKETLSLVLDRIDRIKAYGFHATVSVRLSPYTISGITQILDYALNRQLATVTIHLPLHTRRVEDVFSQDEDLITLLKPVFEHFCNLKGKWLIETYIPWAQYHPLMQWLKDKVQLVHRGCRAGRDRLAVFPTGEISPCVCMDIPQAYAGNIKNSDLNDLFENSPVCQMMRSPESGGICKDCSNVNICGAGCRAAAYSLTGSINGQDRSCPVWESLLEKEGADNVTTGQSIIR